MNGQRVLNEFVQGRSNAWMQNGVLMKYNRNPEFIEITGPLQEDIEIQVCPESKSLVKKFLKKIIVWQSSSWGRESWLINLTHLSLMDLPTLISRMSLLPILGMLGSIFHFYSYFNRTFWKQTVETQIRRRVLRRLIWVCTYCLCTSKKDAIG